MLPIRITDLASVSLVWGAIEDWVEVRGADLEMMAYSQVRGVGRCTREENGFGRNGG